MDMLRLAGCAVCAALMSMLLRRLKGEMGLAASVAAGILLIVLVLPQLSDVVQGVGAIASAGGVTEGYLKQLLKICGVSLLIDFAAQTCRDAGEAGLAVKAEFAGRVALLAQSLPFMQALLTQILSLSC